ncbi:MAG: helix-turn-helix domain-containing protein [Thalassobaculum sp.]|uniref:winged helix-turn-helix transcriptional regulator n=1 Tax=Thalassobaculum sp. TaxID=2022740 RepID=UPI0032EE85FB
MRNEQRSGCPINLSLEVFGDRWSLIVLRDMMFGNRRHFREILSRSQEGIASNILSARLKHLLDLGMITKADDPSHKQKAIYSLTEKAIELVPVFATLGAWGRRHLPVSRELAIRARLLEEGGPELWAAFMEELRSLHLGAPRKPGARPVLAELRAAYERELAEVEAEAG